MGKEKSQYDGWLDKYFTDTDKNGTILELGCGWGDDTAFLAKTGYNIISCDYSDCAIRNVQKHYPTVTVNRLNLLEPLPFGSAFADIVIASLCLHYFTDSDMRQILAEIGRIVKRNGMFLCRLNSENGRRLGVEGETELEPGVYMTKNGIKRFFTESTIKNVFQDWIITHIEEYRTNKFSNNICLFEIAMTLR